METFATPFNLLFLPKFAEVKRRSNQEEIKYKVSIVIDFVITFLPLLTIMVYGFSKYIVVIFFGHKYIPAVSSVSIVILFSFFYIGYVLARGVLDALFHFPYVNVICLTSFLTVGLLSHIFCNNIFLLAIDFCIGIAVMGITALWLLIKKCNVSIQIQQFLLPVFLSIITFLILFIADRYIDELIINEYWTLLIFTLNRILLFFVLFLIYWKPKTLWMQEVLIKFQLK